MNSSLDTPPGRNPVKAALRKVAPWFLAVGTFSAGINLLMLTGSLYMLQVYDRVLSSSSIETLIALSLIALVAYSVQGILDAMRSRMLTRIGAEFEKDLSPQVFDAVTSVSNRGTSSAQAIGPERDLEAIRSFLSGMGPTALLDLPFMPLFFLGCFILHPILGWLAVGGALMVIAGAVLVEKMSASRSKPARELAVRKMVFMEAGRRNAEAIVSMGLRPALRKRWNDLNEEHTRAHISLGDVSASVGSFVKVARLILQSAVIGVGGYLAINQQISSGCIIAASVMLSRGLAPIEIAVANWKGFVAFRQGFSRLSQLLSAAATSHVATELPAPRSELRVEGLTVVPLGGERPTVINLDFALPAGSALCIMGPSASGKSSLARALVGIWRAVAGQVRLDGAALDNWTDAALGRHIGYLPQDIGLFDGTIADNIGRFDGPESSKAIISAAMSAGAHDMILNMPQGYDSEIGEGGARLSGGQRQRIALARALYRLPFLVVLDEPNSNLDAEGERALNQAILSIRRRGGIAVVISHRQSALTSCDFAAVMIEGRFVEFGRREEMVQRIVEVPPIPLKAMPQDQVPPSAIPNAQAALPRSIAS